MRPVILSKYFKYFLLLATALLFVSTVSSQSVQVEGLVEQDIDTSLEKNGVHFQTEYLDKTVPYKDVFVPEQYHPYLADFDVNYKNTKNNGNGKGGNQKFSIDFSFENVDKSSLPNKLNGYTYTADFKNTGSINGGQTSWTVQSSVKQVSGNPVQEDADYDLKILGNNERAEVDGSLNRVNGSTQIVNDGELNFNASAQTFAFDSGIIKPRVSSHYEHLIVEHEVRSSVSPEYGETLETTENVYSGEDPDRVAFSDYSDRSPSVYDSSRGQVVDSVGLEYDNLYEESQKEITVISAYPSENSLLELKSSGNRIERLDSPGAWYETYRERHLSNGLSDSVLLENRSGYSFVAYNTTVPADSTADLEVVTDPSSRWDNDRMGMWVLGSTGGSLSEGESTTFDYTGSVQSIDLDGGFEYRFAVFGAGGGNGDDLGGYGGFVNGTYSPKSSKTLDIYVGEGPTNEIGGWGYYDGGDASSDLGGGGGGSTDVRLSSGSLLVAADAGGGGGITNTGLGDPYYNTGGGGGSGGDASDSCNTKGEDAEGTGNGGFGGCQEGGDGGVRYNDSIFSYSGSAKGGGNAYEEDGKVVITNLGSLNNPLSLPSLDSPSNESSGLDNSLTLEASVSDPDGDDLTVSFYWGNGTEIATNTGVTSGSSTSVSVSGLDWGTSYDWYAVADDGSASTESGTASFTTQFAPSINSTSITPDPPSIFENVSYQSEVSDSENSIQNTCLTVTYGTQEVVSNECRTGTSPNWNDVFVPQSANKWLNATFTVTDTQGASSTKELNRFLEDTRPSFQINDPENITYTGQDAPYQVDFNDDGDNNPGEEAYCEAYNDGNLVRNATVNENDAGSFSGTISNTVYGLHNFEVECTEFGLLVNQVTTKNVFYTTEEIEPNFVLDEPQDGDVFQYAEGDSGTDVSYTGNVDTGYSGIIRVVRDGTTIYSTLASSGSSSYFTQEELSEGNYTYFVEFESDDTGNVYQSNSRDFEVVTVPNPPPVIENVSYDDVVSEDTRLGIDVRASDSSDYLDKIAASAYNTRGDQLSRDVQSFSSGTTVGWKNFTNLARTNRPGNYTLEVEVYDNVGILTEQNYTVFSRESPASFNLTSPVDTVGTGGASNFTTSYDFSASLPADGSLEVLSRSSETGYGVVDTVNVTKGSYSNGNFVENITGIDYEPIAGEQFDASQRYSWFVRFNSSFSNDTYTSSVRDWRFTSQQPEAPEEEGRTAVETIVFLIKVFFVGAILLLLLYFPLWLRSKIGDDGILG